jgi:hypothetical protein
MNNGQVLACQLNWTAIVSQPHPISNISDTSTDFYYFKIEQIAFCCFSTGAGFKPMKQLGALLTQPPV